MLYKNQPDRPLLVIIAGYQAIMMVLLILFFDKVTYSPLWLVFHLAVFVFLGWNRSPVLNAIKKWSVIVLIPLNFTELHYLVHTVHPIDYDQLLIEIDRFLFSVDPTIWLERFTYPALTEFLQIIYSTFYFLPIGLGVILARRQQHEPLNLFVFQMVFGFYLSYLGYFILPAIGPRFTLDHLQSFPLTGIWIAQDIQHLLNTLENSQRDAFPSGHTAMTLLTLYYAGKYHKSYFHVMIPITILMLFSTVYLRYHYVIDVIAGVALFVFTVWSGEKLYQMLKKRE